MRRVEQAKCLCLPLGSIPGGSKALLLRNRKRHILVDTLGLLIACSVEPADISDRKAAALLLGGLRPLFQEYRLHRTGCVLGERMLEAYIPLLATHFIELLTNELGCPKPRLTRAGLEILQHYEWPGNIRELRNVIERAVISARGCALEFDVPGTGYPKFLPMA
jgi:hypothetical protein